MGNRKLIVIAVILVSLTLFLVSKALESIAEDKNERLMQDQRYNILPCMPCIYH